MFSNCIIRAVCQKKTTKNKKKKKQINKHANKYTKKKELGSPTTTTVKEKILCFWNRFFDPMLNV